MDKIVLYILANLVVLGVFSKISYAGPNFDGAVQIGVYGGYNSSFDSDVSIKENGTNLTHRDVEWDGDSFGNAPYWGVRATYWPDALPNWGFMIDYTHAKMKAEKNSGSSSAGNVGQTYERLEFTDGLNLVTANVLYKHNDWQRIKPYVGAGVGLSIPHVEVRQTGAGAAETLEYQVAGVAAQVLVGVEVELNDNFSVFTEYKLSYAQIDADLSSGGNLETEGLTNHFIFGLSYKFGGSRAQPLK